MIAVFQDWWFIVLGFVAYLLAVAFYGIREAEQQEASLGLTLSGLVLCAWLLTFIFSLARLEPPFNEIASLVFIAYTSAVFGLSFLCRDFCVAFRGVAITIRSVNFPRSELWLAVYAIALVIVLVLKVIYLWF